MNYSAIWSSLRTLEITNHSVEPAKGYDIFFGNIRDKKLRHQKLASGLALIGASSSDAKTVTVELTEGSSGHSADSTEQTS
jgi:hypothetical protein